MGYLIFAIMTVPLVLLTRHVKRAAEIINQPWIERQTLMADFTSDWTDRRTSELNVDETRLGKPGVGRFLGTIELNINDTSLQIFDWQTATTCVHARDQVRLAKQGMANDRLMVFQTVIVFSPHELDMPQFSLHPKANRRDDIPLAHPMQYSSQSFESPVITGTYFDADNSLMSIQPYLIKQVFNSEPGRTKLIPFLEEWGFTVEWTEKKLMVYRVGHIIEPNQIQDFARLVLELVDLLREADAAADKYVDERIELSHQNA